MILVIYHGFHLIQRSLTVLQYLFKMIIKDNNYHLSRPGYVPVPPIISSHSVTYHKEFPKDSYKEVIAPGVTLKPNYKSIKLFNPLELVKHLQENLPLVRKNIQQFDDQMQKLSLTFGNLIVKGFHIDEFLKKFFQVIDKRVKVFFDNLDKNIFSNTAYQQIKFPIDFQLPELRSKMRQKVIEISNLFVEKFMARATPLEYDREVLKKVEAILRLYDIMRSDQSFSLLISITKFDLSVLLQKICDNKLNEPLGLQELIEYYLVISMKNITQQTQYILDGQTPLYLQNKDIIAERFHQIIKDREEPKVSIEDVAYISKTVSMKDRRVIFNEFYTVINKELKAIAPEYYQYVTDQKNEYQKQRESLYQELMRCQRVWEELKLDENYYLVQQQIITEEELRTVPLESEAQLNQLHKLNQFSIKASNLQYDSVTLFKNILDHKKKSKEQIESQLQLVLKKVIKTYDIEKPGQNPYSGQLSKYIDQLFKEFSDTLGKDLSQFKNNEHQLEQLDMQIKKKVDNPYLQSVKKDLIRQDLAQQNLQKHAKQELVTKSDYVNAQVAILTSQSQQRQLSNEDQSTRPFSNITGTGKVLHGSSADYHQYYDPVKKPENKPEAHQPGKYEQMLRQDNEHKQISRDPYISGNQGYYVDKLVPPKTREELTNQYVKPSYKQPEPPKKPEPPKEPVKQPEPSKKPEPPKEPIKQPEPPKKPDPPKEPIKQPEPPKKPEPPKEPIKQPEPPKKPEPPKEPVKQPEPPKKPEPPKEPIKQPEPPKKPEPPKEPIKQPEPPKKPEPPKEPIKQPEPPKKPEPPKEPIKQPEPPKKPEPPKEPIKQPEPPKKPEPPKEPIKQPEPPKKPEPPKEPIKQPEPPKKPEPPKEPIKQPEPPKKPEPPKEPIKQPEPPKKPDPPKEPIKQPEPPKKPEPPKEPIKQPEPPKKPEPPKEPVKQPEPQKKPEPPKEPIKQPEPPKKPEPPKAPLKQPEIDQHRVPSQSKDPKQGLQKGSSLEDLDDFNGDFDDPDDLDIGLPPYGKNPPVQIENDEEQEPAHQLNPPEKAIQLNKYIKGTKYGKQTKVDFTEYDVPDRVLQLFEEFVVQKQIYILSVEESDEFFQILEKMMSGDEPGANALLEQCSQQIVQNMVNILRSHDFNPECRYFIPFNDSELGFNMMQVDPKTNSIFVYFPKDPSQILEENNEVFEMMVQIVQTVLVQTQTEEPPQVIPLNYQPECLKVLQTMAPDMKNIEFIAQIYSLIVEQYQEEVHLTSETMERIFWSLDNVDSLFDVLENQLENFEQKFQSILDADSQGVAYECLSAPLQPGGLDQMAKKLVSVRQDFQKNKSIKQYFLLVQIEVDEQEVQSYYIHLSRVGNLFMNKLFVLEHYESVLEMISNYIMPNDGVYTQKLYVDQAKHNFLYQYGFQTLAAWIHLCQKKNMSAEDALGLLSFSSVPYWLMYSGQE